VRGNQEMTDTVYHPVCFAKKVRKLLENQRMGPEKERQGDSKESAKTIEGET